MPHPQRSPTTLWRHKWVLVTGGRLHRGASVGEAPLRGSWAVLEAGCQGRRALYLQQSGVG